MLRLLVVLVVSAGCMAPHSEVCGGGGYCAEGLVCDPAGDRCLTPDQATGCRDLGEGDLCTADGRAGRCTTGACVPACGDGVLDGGEQCDDANYASHDGCSSACLVETQSWQRWEDPWIPRNSHGAAYDVEHDRLVVFGGANSGALGDTWQRVPRPLVDDSTWSLSIGAGPSPRTGVMAYDPVRKVTVLFGGFNAGGGSVTNSETWEFDGTSWRLRSLAVSPPARGFHAMVFDPTRGKVVMFGGTDFDDVLGDTWTYDGAWVQIATAGPSGFQDAMAYSPGRAKVVLFGGASGGETWELGAAGWSQVMTPGPLARRGAAMAYLKPAAGPGALVLFGGAGGMQFSDTWRYDGTWTQVVLADQPPATFRHTLTAVPDPATPGASKLVLVGGATVDGVSDQVWEYTATVPARWRRVTAPVGPNAYDNPAAVGGDGAMLLYGVDRSLWTFDGASWRSLTSAAFGPTSRGGYACAYDGGRGRFVMYGGRGSAVEGDTWEFDGQVLRDVTAPGDPPARSEAVAAYDEARHVVVMVGGDTTTFVDETWEYDGTWHKRSPATSPGPQLKAAMAYDPVHKRVVLLAVDGTTWAYDGTWSQLAVPGMAPRKRSTMAFDRARRRLVVFGGKVGGNLAAESLELTDAGWQVIAIGGANPTARTGASLVYAPSAHALVMFGGQQASGAIPNDTWLLAYRSVTPDEACNDGQDNDGDGRVDNADPDCSGL